MSVSKDLDEVATVGAAAREGLEEALSSTDVTLEPQKHRILDKWSYLFAWMGGCVSIGTFAMGSSIVGTLNLVQASVAMAIGCIVIGIALTINDQAGHAYGIPFIVQARSSFGFGGVKIPGLIRAVPAIVWFGFQSWIGAGALNQVSATLIGFDNLIFYFILFQVLQVALSMLGFQGIKWLENIGCVFILASLVYMFYSVVTKYGGAIGGSITNLEGTWGVPFWNATMLFLGIYATMILNVSDYSRELVTNVRPAHKCSIYVMAILPATMFMGLIGLMVSGATGIADPIKVFSSAVDNKVLLVVTLLFIAFAQITTNVLNNVVPPALVLVDAFKISYKKAAVVVGLISFGTFPWELVKDESAAGLQLFVEVYSAFLGPLFAILAVDYYLLRRQKLNLDNLYKAGGPYRGVNWRAVIATLIGVAFAFAFMSVSWYASLIPAGIIYYALMRMGGSANRFME
ncbi:MAG: NCS1 family transporter [Planctomycetota bacterium]|jgi:NCS1 family nucleobase:cation symporter-1|nr:NCS1 family transporter [Planctomycetota bacterium]